jgi:SRSO17 transposase
MSNRKSIPLGALVKHHDPTCASFVNGVHSVTGALLLDKKTLCLRNPADEPLELAIGIDSSEKVHAIETSDVSLNLADRRAQQRSSECNFNAGRSLVTYRSDFARISVKHCRDNREYCVKREINKNVSAVRLLGDIARREMNDANVPCDFGTIDLR